MLILVTGDNYFVMFVGWEGIGISSYLLINFWYTRIQANKSAIKALVVNRVGDLALSVSFFAIFFAFANLDYATVFSIAPFINETSITIIGLLFLGGAAGKSALLGLHVWLPDAMEGQRSIALGRYFLILTMLFIFIFSVLWFYVAVQEFFLRMPSPSIDLLQHTTELLHPDAISGLAVLPAILKTVSQETLEEITGNMLGDGSIQCRFAALVFLQKME